MSLHLDFTFSVYSASLKCRVSNTFIPLEALIRTCFVSQSQTFIKLIINSKRNGQIGTHFIGLKNVFGARSMHA